MAARLTLEYDGTGFAGWGRQSGGAPGHDGGERAPRAGERTVQDEVERALGLVRRAPTQLTVAGRTDRGVHAWGQVASHPGESVSLTGLNALLPPDVAVLQAQETERARVARDLHDEANQSLTGILLRLEASVAHAPPALESELRET